MPIDPNKNLFREFLEASKKRSKRANQLYKVLNRNLKVDTDKVNINKNMVNSLTKVINSMREKGKNSEGTDQSDVSLLDIHTSNTA